MSRPAEEGPRHLAAGEMSRATAWALLAAAVLLWGINWPVMKIGLAYSDPFWFAAIRSLLATLFLMLVQGARGRLVPPQRADWPILASIGAVQVGGCMTLVHVAVVYGDAGRASVLAYTTPIWAAPLAFMVLAERLRPAQVVSLVLGMAGLVVLILPSLGVSESTDKLLGIALPTGSAMLWAGVIVHVRAHRWNRPLLDLMPWQFLVGGLVQLLVALLVIGPPAMTMAPAMVGIMIYNAVPATVFAFWAYLSAARHLPATATAIGSLGIPMVGVLSAGVLLGERLTGTELIALGLLAAGIGLSSLRGR